MKLKVNAFQELKWQKKNYVFISIRNVKITKVIHTYASLEDQGASHGSSATGGAVGGDTGGLCDEKKMHKNVSELKFSLLFKGLYQTKIIAHKIMGENTTAIFCVRKMNHTLCLKNRNFAIYGRPLLGC